MPTMSFEEFLEVTGIQSISGSMETAGLVTRRPFRAPHHTITGSALVGGGMIPKPGELTLAHRGILFLDELPEFHTRVLDALREPLEEKKVHITRTGGRCEFPADCLVIGAMNPCKCGYYPDRNRCQCSEGEIRRYFNKISGPFLDRIDICVEVSRQDIWEISGEKAGKSSDYYRERIERAIELQKKRNGGVYNSRLVGQDLIERCEMNADTLEFLKCAYDKFLLSMRGYYKVLRVARTIADLKGVVCVTEEHIAQALSYRVEKTFKG
jgi:magnesium chelatase family protein